MPILLVKADQLHLFEKLVPVKAAIRKDGTVQAAHTAIRHVRAPEPKHKPEVRDLFSAPAPAEAAPADYHETRATEQAAAKERVAAKRASRKSVEVEQQAEQVNAQDMREVSEVEPPADASPAEAAGIEPIDTGPAIAIYQGLDYDGQLPEPPAFGVPVGMSKGERRAINARAAAMVGERVGLFDEAPPAVDPMTLAQYSGYGGCGDSLNEFYTEPAVAAGMWKALYDMGAVGPGATVLEPSCATGVFLSTAPTGVKVTGVELDGVSAKIGAALHPLHEVIHSPLEAFATTDTRQFDAIIGNAPFGIRGACQRQDKRDISLHEAYFMDTSLDKLKPGGVVAMVVNTTLMNSKNMRKMRERLLRKGEFLGAIRMPNTAFEAAHTDVTSDILFFRKRPGDVAGALGAVDQETLKIVGAWDDEYLAGTYFEGRGSENVLGEVGTATRAFGEIYTVNGSMIGVPAAIAQFKPASISTGPAGVDEVIAAAPADMAERIRGAALTRPYDQAKRGDIKVEGGARYILDGDPLRWHLIDEYAAQQSVIDAQEVSTLIERAMQGETIEGLESKVRQYVAEHGIPSKNANLQIAAKSDKVIYRLIGAVKPDGSLSDLVSGRAADPVESSFDAAAQTLAMEVGDFSPSMVAARWGDANEETVLDHLYASPSYALIPETGMWTSMDNYLTGELWPKLDSARAALAGEDVKPEDRAKCERQVKALEDAIAPKALEDVECMLNSAFIPLPVVAAFFNDPDRRHSWVKTDLRISFDEGVYAVTGGSDSALLSKYLNRTGVKKETEQPTIDRWNEEFKNWLCASAYREEVEDLYNRAFRGFRQKSYSDEAFDVPGLRSEGLKSYQWSGLRWALEAGKGIIAADVGLGKTARALILSKLLRATGRAKRPLIVVPKSVAANWMREAEKWFPGSKVMVIGETYTRDKKTGELRGRSDTAGERNQKYHDITQNEYDFILVTQPAWNELDLDPETKDRLQEQDFWEQRKRGLEGAKEKKRQAMRDRWDSAKVAEEFERRTDAIYFNDLGVDAILSDEMHAYKNLFEARPRFGQTPKFLGGSGSSKRAADMRYKSAFVRENGGTIYGLTATPTKNSPLEVYSMLSHIAPEAFERIGIRNSEEFLDRFCVFEEQNILSTTGQMESALCTVGFKNLDELREIMRRYIDRKTAEDVGLQLPEANQEQHLLEMSAAQREVYAQLRQEAEAAAQAKEATGEGHIFSIMSRMAKASLDLELYDPVKYAGATSPKYEELALKVKAGRENGGQIVFCDHIEAHDKIVKRLVEAGIPAAQIGVINGKVATTSAKRQAIAEAYRAGKLRVVVGNTATMGEGVDGLQADTSDIHHMDWPWEPATLQQRNGRGRRQGNEAESINIHSYLGRGTFDGYRYQTVMAKRDWQDALWNGGDRLENMSMQGSVSREDMLVMLADDPDAAREKLTANKAAAQARFDAQKFGEAADAYSNFRMKADSLNRMGAREREKPSARRLKVQVDRLRTALEANTHFKAQHLLDAKHAALLQPSTGVAFEPGSGFESDGTSKLPAGRYVVEKVHPEHNQVTARRWGASGPGARSGFKLEDLGVGVTAVEHDAKAEEAHIAEHAAADLSGVSSMAKLREIPSAALNARYAAVQKHVKDGMRAYKFNHGYGDIGVVRYGRADAIQSYESSKIGDGDDVMLPTDEHRALAMDAFHADHFAAKPDKSYSTSRGRTQTQEVVRYPGRFDQSTNRWNSIIRDLWGEEGLKDARAASDQRLLESARRAGSMPEALNFAWKTALGDHGSAGKWSRKALATLWAAAKKHDAMTTPLHSMARMPSRLLTVGDPNYGRNIGHEATGSALTRLAADQGYHDLAAAMVIDALPDPVQAATTLMELPASKARADALKHLIAKNPDLAQHDYRGQTLAKIAEQG